jgi:hypothetical protein
VQKFQAKYLADTYHRTGLLSGAMQRWLQRLKKRKLSKKADSDQSMKKFMQTPGPSNRQHIPLRFEDLLATPGNEITDRGAIYSPMDTMATLGTPLASSFNVRDGGTNFDELLARDVNQV